jgi:hypothetical protein
MRSRPIARFRCREWGDEGTFDYFGKHECPKCGSVQVQFALSIEEWGDDDPFIVAFAKLADNKDFDPNFVVEI